MSTCSAGTPDVSERDGLSDEGTDSAPANSGANSASASGAERIMTLEAEIAQLRAEFESSAAAICRFPQPIRILIFRIAAQRRSIVGLRRTKMSTISENLIHCVKTSVHPPKRLLYGPGPSQVYPRIYQAMAQPIVGHLDPYFFQDLAEVQKGLREVFGTQNELTHSHLGHRLGRNGNRGLQLY